jgi:uncharacterized protein (TIGR03382 family)
MISALNPARSEATNPSVPQSPAVSSPLVLARPPLTLALRLSGALAVVAALAAAAGVLLPGIFRDPAMNVGNARGTAVVILAVALPALVSSMALAARGSLRAQMVWLGALCYLLYNSVIFAFAVAFNPLFPLYVASLSLAVWSLVAVLTRVDVAGLPGQFAPHLPVRAIGAYLVATAVAFAVVWLRDIVPALVTNTAPAGLRGTRLPTNPVEVMDLGFTLPLAALAGVWLWRRRPWGYLLAGMLLVMLAIEGASVATDQVFGHLSDPTQPLTAVPVFVALTLVGLVPTVVYLRGLVGKPGATPSSR